jgi:GNAT superfamily N-acetyltransferase
MTDPTDALVSFQQAFLSARFRKELLRGEIDPALFVHSDRPAGEPRFTYVKADNGRVTAMAIFIKADPVDRTPCFGVGVAVAEAHRGKGLAKRIVEAAITEMKNGMTRNGLKGCVATICFRVSTNPPWAQGWRVACSRAGILIAQSSCSVSGGTWLTA